MTDFTGRPRHRGVCVRCRSEFDSPVKFSHHLSICHQPFDVDFIMEILHVEVTEDCWLMHDPRGAKYVPKFGVEPKKVLKVHEIVAIAVHGDRPEGTMLCHWCDNRKCLNPEHLYWGTAKENSLDAWGNKRRTMSPSQLQAMVQGRLLSEKFKERVREHNRELARRHRGDAHWTHRSPEEMQRWVDAMAQGRVARAQSKRVLEEVMGNDGF